MNKHMSKEVVRGGLILLFLAALTWGELQASTATDGSIPILLLFSVFKAILIIYFFMHISRLWKAH